MPDYEETPRNKHKEKTTVSKTNDPKEQYDRTREEHRAAIKQLKRDIKRHKLLLKQAKITYKLTKEA